jgi:hypothetical protein
VLSKFRKPAWLTCSRKPPSCLQLILLVSRFANAVQPKCSSAPERIWPAVSMPLHYMGVFNEETIGDCYVAVTGIPESLMIMRLSWPGSPRDCMIKMNHSYLESWRRHWALSTMDLEMRFHSGPTTAGSSSWTSRAYCLGDITLALAWRVKHAAAFMSHS